MLSYAFPLKRFYLVSNGKFPPLSFITHCKQASDELSITRFKNAKDITVFSIVFSVIHYVPCNNNFL